MGDKRRARGVPICSNATNGSPTSFSAEYLEALRALAETAHHYQAREDSVRRCPLKKFPHGIVYDADVDERGERPPCLHLRRYPSRGRATALASDCVRTSDARPTRALGQLRTGACAGSRFSKALFPLDLQKIAEPSLADVHALDLLQPKYSPSHRSIQETSSGRSASQGPARRARSGLCDVGCRTAPACHTRVEPQGSTSDAELVRTLATTRRGGTGEPPA